MLQPNIPSVMSTASLLVETRNPTFENVHPKSSMSTSTYPKYGIWMLFAATKRRVF